MSIIKISSISQLHKMMDYAKPKHPLISLIDASKIHISEEKLNIKVYYDFYMLSMKDKSCGLEYGRRSFDFGEGAMVFSAPGQTFSGLETIRAGEINGWMLIFHPDLIRNTHLGQHIDSYTFFHYDVTEALHLSEAEEKTIDNTVKNIETEYEQRIDNHSQKVIVSNLELLLNYCLRFYERQYNTRSNQNKDTVTQFEIELKNYFKSKKHLDLGMPTIQYFADLAHLSQHYFSDLIKKETGRSPKNHIHDFVIGQAKNLLMSSDKSVSEIAYRLGFNYPHYFTRLFKTKTGYTPLEYREQN